jgi:S1-C subfamily serine protease
VVINEIRFQAPGGNQTMLVVGRVLQNSTAGGAGLRQGDVLLSVDGQSVDDMRSLLSVLRSGQGVRVLRILRDRQVSELSIQLQQ